MTKQETAAEMQQASLIKLAESTKFKKVGQLVDPLTFIPSTSVEGIFNPEDLQDAFAYFGPEKSAIYETIGRVFVEQITPEFTK